MMKFKKDKVKLLKELRELVIDNLDNAGVKVDLEYEVAELLTEITDKRRFRRLKTVCKELNKWIDELVSEKKEKTNG